MATVDYSKIISKSISIVKDIEEPDYSDAVLHSKNLIDLLTSHALKILEAPDKLRFERNITDEQKMEYLLDKNYISEKVYDNCLNTKGLRNPTEHIATYPNEYFAKGAALSAIEMYFALQEKLNLPQIKIVDKFAIKYEIETPVLLHINASKYIDTIQLSKINSIVQKYPGPYPCIIDFPPGTVHPNGVPAKGIQLIIKSNFNVQLFSELKEFDFVGNVEWAGLETFRSLPYVAEHNREQYGTTFGK